MEADLSVARLLDVAEGQHAVIGGAGGRADLGIDQALEGRDHIVDRERRAVMPLHSLAYGEGPGLGIRVCLPRGCEPRVQGPVWARIAEIFKGGLVGVDLAGIR